MKEEIEVMKIAKKEQLGVFYTAGYPTLESTVKIAVELEEAGATMIELGIPFSDPMADGTVIQEASTKALANGMNLHLLLEQVEEIKKNVEIPIILMGYLNPVFQYGVAAFLEKCSKLGVDGLILPDLSVEVYEREYKTLFDKYDMPLTFLITPETSEKRREKIISLSKSFIYFVSTSSITGKQRDFSDEQKELFASVDQMAPNHEVYMGFGIHNRRTFHTANTYFDGAIIGSAFIKALEEDIPVGAFVQGILNDR